MQKAGRCVVGFCILKVLYWWLARVHKVENDQLQLLYYGTRRTDETGSNTKFYPVFVENFTNELRLGTPEEDAVADYQPWRGTIALEDVSALVLARHLHLAQNGSLSQESWRTMGKLNRQHQTLPNRD